MRKKQSEESLKSFRQLYIYNKLLSGEKINISGEAVSLGVTSRTISRDIEDLRSFFESNYNNGCYPRKKLVFDRISKCYSLSTDKSDVLSSGELLSVCRILLDSRAFKKEDISGIIEKLLKNCLSESERRDTEALLVNELYHYIEPIHGQKCAEAVGSLWNAAHSHKIAQITYKDNGGKISELRLMPVMIMFSERYFYLAAFRDDDSMSESENFPEFYRIDRIKSCRILDEMFYAPYGDKLEEGEFRKRLQFAHGGKLRKIRFLYKGSDPEPALDRFPTAVIQEKNDDGFIISAEVFGSGADIWINAQNGMAKLL